jgi:hypothetical protein
VRLGAKLAAATIAAVVSLAALAGIGAAVGGPGGGIQPARITFSAHAISVKYWRCRGADGKRIDVRNLLFVGKSVGSDPRLTGRFQLRAIMVNTTTVDGYVTGTMITRNPKTGDGFEASYRATAFGKTDGTALMDGFIVGTAHKPNMRLFANFTAHGDVVNHKINGVMGFEDPSLSPHDAAVLFVPTCAG